MKTILIVDDERDLCEVLKEAFRKEDYDVDCAFSLAEADQKMKKHPRIVILDNQLPDGTGIDYLSTHAPIFLDIVVLMISADTEPQTIKRAKKAGVQEFLPKPFTLQRIKELLRKVA